MEFSPGLVEGGKVMGNWPLGAFCVALPSVASNVAKAGGSASTGDPELSTVTRAVEPSSVSAENTAGFFESIPEKQIRDLQEPEYTQPYPSGPHFSIQTARGIQRWETVVVTAVSQGKDSLPPQNSQPVRMRPTSN